MPGLCRKPGREKTGANVAGGEPAAGRLMSAASGALEPENREDNHGESNEIADQQAGLHVEDLHDAGFDQGPRPIEKADALAARGEEVSQEPSSRKQEKRQKRH